MREVHLGLYGLGLAGWGGGRDLLRVCANALAARRSGDPPVRVSVFLEGKTPLAWLHDTLVALRGSPAALSRGRRSPPRRRFPGIDTGPEPFADLLSDAVEIVPTSGFAWDLRRQMLRRGISALFFFNRPLRSRLAWNVGYVPDLQHRTLPRFFSPADLRRRDAACAATLRRCRDVLVTSRATAADVALHFPGSRARLHVLPFCPYVTPALLSRLVPEPELRTRYELDGDYFVVSNQFWQHKDHLTAFRALRAFIDRDRDSDAVLVCTGDTSDERRPEYFHELRRALQELELDARVRILGSVPKSVQLSLVRSARALLQPSLFEGTPGGLAAFDAIAVGTPVIASAIPVNAEIDKGRVVLFRPGDPADLATAMAGIVRTPAPRLAQDHTRNAWALASALIDVAQAAGGGA